MTGKQCISSMHALMPVYNHHSRALRLMGKHTCTPGATSASPQSPLGRQHQDSALGWPGWSQWSQGPFPSRVKRHSPLLGRIPLRS